MKKYAEMTKEELSKEIEELRTRYKKYQDMSLTLDMIFPWA